MNGLTKFEEYPEEVSIEQIRDVIVPPITKLYDSKTLVQPSITSQNIIDILQEAGVDTAGLEIEVSYFPKTLNPNDTSHTEVPAVDIWISKEGDSVWSQRFFETS